MNNIRKKRLQTRKDRILTLANLISILRIILSIPLVISLENENVLLSFILKFKNTDLTVQLRG